MATTVKYSALFIVLILLILYLVLGQVETIHTRRADFVKLDWVTTWLAPDALMGQMPGFNSGPFVFVEHVDVEVTNDGSIYAANDKLRKLNPGGGIAWQSSVVLDEDVIPTAVYFKDVYIDPAGDIYALGHLRYMRESWLELEDIEPVKTMFLTKYSDDGELLWQKIWDDEVSGRVWGTDIVTDSEGNPIIFGNFELQMDMDPGDGSLLLINESNPKIGGDPEAKLEIDDYDGFILKLTPEGDFIDVFTWSGTIYAGVLMPHGGLLFTGNNVEAADSIIPDSVFVSMDTDFQNHTVHEIPENSRLILFHEITAGPDGYPVAIGTSKLNDQVSGVVCRMDDNIGFLSQYVIGEPGAEVYPLGIATSPSGDIFVAGGFASINEVLGSALDFDTGNKIDLHAGPFYEIFITKFSPGGEYQWTGSFGGDRNDWAGGITVDNNGKLIVLGYFQNDVDFDPSPRDMFQKTNSDIGEFLMQLTEWPG